MFKERSLAFTFFTMTCPMFFIMVMVFRTRLETYIRYCFMNQKIGITIITREMVVINAIIVATTTIAVVTIKRNLLNSVYV